MWAFWTLDLGWFSMAHVRGSNSADIYEIWFSVHWNYSSLPRQPIMCVASYAFYLSSSSLFSHSKQLLVKTQPFDRRIPTSPRMLRFELRHLSGRKVSAYLDSLSTSSGRGCGDVGHRLGKVSESFKADLSMCCYGLVMRFCDITLLGSWKPFGDGSNRRLLRRCLSG